MIYSVAHASCTSSLEFMTCWKKNCAIWWRIGYVVGIQCYTVYQLQTTFSYLPKTKPLQQLLTPFFHMVLYTPKSFKLKVKRRNFMEIWKRNTCLTRFWTSKHCIITLAQNLSLKVLASRGKQYKSIATEIMKICGELSEYWLAEVV